MKIIAIQVIIILLSLNSANGQRINLQFNPIPASFNINLPNSVYATDINYDSTDISRQAFHIFLPDTSGTFPLVILIHGGGFINGSRDVVLKDPDRKADVKYFLENGVAYASIGYRLIEKNQGDTIGVIKCLMDCKRALQFIRFYSSSLHINPIRVALTGPSAGAGTSLWLATSSDMANPNDSDPVLKESTRVSATAIIGSQATYDLYKWETDVFHNFDGQGTCFTVDSMINLLGFQRYSNFYGGIDSAYQILYDPFLIQYRQDVDMLYHISNDDPPLYINSPSMAIHPRQDPFHHPFHGREIHTAALNSSLVEVKALIPAIGVNTTQGESINEFIVRHLTNPTSVQEGIFADKIVFMAQNYPNPFYSHTTIRWKSSVSGQTTINVFDVLGRKVKTLVDEFKQQGEYMVQFDSNDLPSATYFYQLKVGNYMIKNKMITFRID